MSTHPPPNTRAKSSTFLRIVLLWVTTAGGMLGAHTSWAYCSGASSNVSLPSTLTIQRDVTPGTVLATGQVTTTLTCDPTGADPASPWWGIQPSSSNTDHGSTSINDVRQTSVPGIGIRWRHSSTLGYRFWSRAPFNAPTIDYEMFHSAVRTVTDTFELVRVSGTPTSQTLPAMTLTYDFKSRNTDGVPPTFFYSLTLPQIDINVLACEVMLSSINVPLNNVEKRNFAGPGSTAGGLDFVVPLQCDAGTRVNFQIDAAPDSSGEPGVIQLDSPGSAGVAHGVGIQLTQAGTPITLGAPKPLGTVAATGNFDVPMRASYYQTASAIEPGQANGTATFTLTYN